MLVGASNADNATELAAYESRFGPLRVRRSYDQPTAGVPASWSACVGATDAGTRASVYSFKPSVAAVAAGDAATVARLRTFLGSVPKDGFRRYLCLWHEPEGEIKDGLFTVAQFRTATARWRDLVAETGRPELVPVVIFAGTQCFDGQTQRAFGWDADDLTPPGVAVGFDAYNRYPGDPWRSLQYRFQQQVDWAKAGGRRWGVSETGCYEYQTGTNPDGSPVYDSALKVTWTAQGVDWARANGAEFFTYWDQAFQGDVDKLARRLHSSVAHINLWRSINAAQ